MSRCFPFPPPGYDKKATTDDVDLLKKEKRREKKHDKEKKDNEKRDSKEKKEKKEKKDKKEKHRDKKKDKEKDRDKDKAASITSDEKKLKEKPEGHNGEILGKKEDRKKVTDNSSQERCFSGKFVGTNGDKLTQNSVLSYESKNSHFVQELGKRISDAGSAVENQSTVKEFIGVDRRKAEPVAGFVTRDIGAMVENQSMVKEFIGVDRRKAEPVAGFATRDLGALVEGKDTYKVKNGLDRRMAGPGSRDESEVSRTPPLHKLPGLVHGKFEGIPRSFEKNIEKEEGKEKVEKAGGGIEKLRGEHRDKDREKKSERRDKSKDKEKKKEEKKLKAKLEHKLAEQHIFKESQNQKNGHIGIHNNKMPDLLNDRDMADSVDGNLRKRKALETNGFLHDTETIPHHRSLIENGRVLASDQSSTKPTSDHRLHKKQKINGTIEGQPMSSTTMKPLPDSSHLPRVLVESGSGLEPDKSSTKPTDRQMVVVANNQRLQNKQKINGTIEGQPMSSTTMKPLPDSPHLPRKLVEGGSVLEPDRSSTEPTSDRQVVVVANNHRLHKKQKIDGMIEGQLVSSTTMKPASPIKTLHPDSKYLDQILSVPKVEEWSDYDDQEWLLASKKSKVGNSCVSETTQVWDKAMQIDSVDIYALPYVIPY